MTRARRVLVVDDEASIRELLHIALTHEGWEVAVAANGADALALNTSFVPEVIVLDIMLPDMSGMQVLSQLRAAGSQVGVVFLTAKTEVSDRVAGLTAGGDDYVVKPFSIEELMARVRALIRRTHPAPDEDTEMMRVGDLTLNEDTFEVFRDGKEISLSTTEFELLRYLMRNAETVLSKTQILDRVWSYDYEGKPTIVELYISYLRKKIDSEPPALIHTVRGQGYMIATPKPLPR